ncbi:MAG: hypothetical protein ACT4OO_07890 [Nitrospiraceae bacterium]
MTSPDEKPDQPTPAPQPSRPAPEKDSESQLNVPGMMVGTALMFIGFLDVFLSISGGFEINVVPLLIYFGGVAIWANSVIENPTIRYAVMTLAVALALAFYSFGEVLFWHKQVVFWTTIGIVVFFMFRTAAPDQRS